jgi:hypothetical protein
MNILKWHSMKMYTKVKEKRYFLFWAFGEYSGCGIIVFDAVIFGRDVPMFRRNQLSVFF